MTQVLIVDDHEENRGLLRTLLECNGYRVTAALDGVEALAAARREPPDVIVSDALMPKMDGFSLCRAWMQDPALRRIPFVFYSATFTDPKDERFAFALGAARYLIKPLESEAFLGELRAVLQEWATRPAPGPASPLDDTAFGALHESARSRKLESKLAQLESMNRKLREGERNYRQLFEANPHPMWVYDLETLRFLAVNDAAIEHYGWSREAFLAMGVADILPPEDVPRLLENVDQVGDKGVNKSRIWRHRNKDGGLIDVEITSHELDFQGRRAKMVLAHDITDRLRVERALHEREERFRTAFEQAAVGMAHVARDGRWLRVNQRLCDIVGYAREELLARGFQDITHPDDLERDLGYVRRLLAGEIPTYSMEKRYLRKDSGTVWINLTVTLARKDSGESDYFISVIEDISARKQAEAALRESDARYRQLFERNPLPIFAIDKETLRFLTINQAAIEKYGYSREEFLAMTIADLQVPEDRARIDAELREQYARDCDEIAYVERRHVTKGGRIIFANVVAQPLRLGDRRVRLISVSDVTERRRAELELRKLSHAIEQSPVSVVITDIEGRIEYVNPKFTQVTGYSAAEVIGRNPQLLQSGEMSPEFYRDLWRTVTSGAAWRGEFHNRRKDGTLFWESATISPVVDDDGRVTHYIGVKEDVTERKLHEEQLRRLNEELERRVEERTHALQVANRELETFSYSVSHDLRAPLRAINGFAHLIEDEYAAQLGERGGELLGRVLAGTEKMGQLIDDLLKLSHFSRQAIHVGPVDLSALAREAADELQAGEPGRRVEWVIAREVTAEGDAGLLKVVLQNLIGNAWKYSSRRDTARIEFGLTERQGRPEYFVRDDGAGFDIAHAQKLFGAFQRLHSAAEFPGSGIGLATVARVIHLHGGEVRAEGRVGGGASFYFTLWVASVQGQGRGESAR